jgi:DNA-binding transcriptional MerR regulator
MLTIGQVAAYVGVTVRAIRHYHQRGLLPEPPRDASGYRRYNADAVAALIRIKILSEAGVPLSRIAELLSAGLAQFAEAISRIDHALTSQIRELEQRKHRIAELGAGERMYLPEQIVGYLDRLRELGVSERSVRLEREGWVLAAARYPGQVAAWAKDKRASLDDPEFRRLYLACDQAYGWAPDDPRLPGLADAMVAFAARRREGPHRPEWTIDDPVDVTLLSSQFGSSSPAWQRLTELGQERARAAGLG